MIGAVAGMFACTAAFAQAEDPAPMKKHEVFVSLGGGLSSMQYETHLGNSEAETGWNFGIGYSYKLNRSWSINAGFELAKYASSMKGSDFSESYDTNDGEYDFTFKTKVSTYSESQRALYLNIPIMAQYELPIGNKLNFYVAGGAKIGIPISSTYTVAHPTVYNEGYYPDLNITYNYLNYKGFGTFYPLDEENDLDLKFAVSVSLETGVKWKFSKKLDLYTGVYADYGLTSVKPDDAGTLVNYDPTAENNFVLNSVLNSSQVNGSSLSDKVIPVSFGLKIRMALPF